MALVLLLVVGLALRLATIGDSLYGDEVGAFYDVTGHGLRRTITLLQGNSPELSPPLFFVLAWASQRIFGATPETLRLVSLLAGMSSIPMVYLLGRLTMTARAGIVAAGLMAVSPFLGFYSIQARPYALLVALTLFATLAVLQALRTGNRWWWAGYAVATCAAAYTHFTSVFPLAILFGWTFVARPQARGPITVASLAAAVGFAPWLPTLFDNLDSPGTEGYARLEPFTAHAVQGDLGSLVIGSPQFPVSAVPGTIGVALGILALVLAVANLAASRPLRRPSAEMVLLLALGLGVPVLLALYSAIGNSLWNSRNLITAWPALAVLAGGLVTAGRHRWAVVGATALVLAPFVIGSLQMTQRDHRRANYDAVASRIAATTPPGTPIVAVSDLGPGPPNSLEVASQIEGTLSDHPVIRLGDPPLADVLKVPPYSPVARHSGEQVAAEALKTSRTRRIAFVLPGRTPLSTLNAARRHPTKSTPASGLLEQIAAFLGALPPDATLTFDRSFRGRQEPAIYSIRLPR